jgi:2-(1,2-epoxy-1,2-dihydrophenyl)acetyl-CoA isomerase
MTGLSTSGNVGEAALLVNTEHRLRILTFNRPDRLNALTPELHKGLHEALADAAADVNVGAVLLKGAGRAFCSGGDVKRSAEQSAGQTPETVEQRADNVIAHGASTVLLSHMPKPTIALINGVAAGSGLSLALACDLRFASADAVFRTAYAGVALSGDLGISHSLTRIVGSARACELMLLNEKIGAEEAFRIGLVHRIYDPSDFPAQPLQIAASLAQGPGVALRYIKQNLHVAESGSLEQVIEREAYNTARCVRTQDVKEAALAFREKRAPVFTGR